MSEHKGWRVRFDARRSSWRGEVRIEGAYRVKTFKGNAAEKEARAWARLEAGGVQLGRPSASLLSPAQVSTDALVEVYLERLTALNRSPSYMSDAHLMLRSLAKAVPVLSAPHADDQIERWLAGLKSSGGGRGGATGTIGPARRNKYLMMVRAMCRWALRKKRLATDPTTTIDYAAVSSYLKPQFSIQEARVLVSHTDSETHRWFLLMLYAGLRADEARCLRWSDIDWSGGSILLRLAGGARIKRRKERIIALQPELRALLQPHVGLPDTRILRLGSGNLQRAFRDLLIAADIPIDGRSPHSCRHTYAGLMAATGIPTTLLRAYLGHASEKTTHAYAEMAARHVHGVERWPRGVFRLMP